ncbi:hypothetical protein BDW66DRAFT_99500 [Aspergillus desertorum]
MVRHCLPPHRNRSCTLHILFYTPAALPVGLAHKNLEAIGSCVVQSLQWPNTTQRPGGRRVTGRSGRANPLSHGYTAFLYNLRPPSHSAPQKDLPSSFIHITLLQRSILRNKQTRDRYYRTLSPFSSFIYKNRF